MQGKDFLYFLKNGDVFKYIDQYGNVTSTTNPTPLEFSPDSWSEISIHSERNSKYWGLDRSFTIPLIFVEDGARILKYIYYTQVTAALIELLIAEQRLFFSDTQYGFYHDKLYAGDIDFTTFSHQGAKVTVNAIEGGIAKAVKANENTVYEIPMDVPEAKFVKFDGINLHATYTYITVDETFGTFKNTSGIYNLGWLLTQPAGNEGTSFNTEQGSTTPLTYFRSNTILNDNRFSDEWFFSATEPVDINIKFTITASMFNGSIGTLYVKNSNGARTVLFDLIGNVSTPVTVSQTYVIDQNFHVGAGEKLYLISQLTQSLAASPEAATLTFNETTIKVTYKSKFKTTYVKCLPILYVWKKICEKMGISFAKTASSILAANSDLVLTCGDALRGLTGAKLKTTLSQFFNSINVPLNIGMGIVGNALRLEGKEFFLIGDIVELGEAAGLKVSPAVDLLFNTFKIGSPAQTYDTVNGRDEPNNTLSFTVDGLVTKEFALISDYRIDSYGAELGRINLDNKKTTDANTDNDIWLIKKTPNPSAYTSDTSLPIYDLDRSLNASATGLIEPETIFNLALSPKNCIRAHEWFIHSCLDKHQGYMYFQTTEKNANMVINGIPEKEDILITSLDLPKFHPVLFEIECVAPDNYADILFANPIRKYNFSYAGVQLTGFAVKTGLEPSTNKSQTFTLLCDGNVDLTSLIDIDQ